ncbi:MAG: hypothetical protein M3319_14390 [Actinomycetota bacterium]|nr:hypothetical protein [Actinomycetota bacterium]
MGRFHKIFRREFLHHAGLFDTVLAAQAAVDTWVTGYNCDRPISIPAADLHSGPRGSDAWGNSLW